MRKTRSGLAAVVVMLFPAVAQGYSVRWRPKSELKADMAKLLRLPVGNVLTAQGYDLKGVRGCFGISLGTYRAKSSNWVRGVMVVYFKSRRGMRMTLRHLGAAKWVRPIKVVDLLGSRTRLTPRGHLSYTVQGPAGRIRWPAVLVVSEGNIGSDRVQWTYIYSLSTPGQPVQMLRLTTLTRRAAKRSCPRCPMPRYVGRRVEGMTFRRVKGSTELTVSERLISSRYDRCRRPSPTRTVYRAVKGRFRQIKRIHGKGCGPAVR
jgi:hypothetical protein